MGQILRPGLIAKYLGLVLFFCIAGSPVYAGLDPLMALTLTASLLALIV